ncbi:MAG: DUF4834 domain-containing protein [Mucilaginibacter polytrichastri]|nr:DUF4834 domain-containing protein [Mucilaginibacter polytrichastri]
MFFRFLIISICILYILRFLARIFLPLLFQNVMNKATQGQAGNAARNEPPRRTPGKIEVEYMPPKKASPLEDKGEFVDYEEIK